MLSHYAGCKFARLAGDPKKIVISQGNEEGVKKPGDLVATVADEELAEELVHLWNEGVNYVIEREEKILDKMEAEAMEKIKEAGKPASKGDKKNSVITGFIYEVEKTLEYGRPTMETLQLISDNVDVKDVEEVEETTPDIEAFIDDIRDTLDGPEGNPTLNTLELVYHTSHDEIRKNFLAQRHECANAKRMVDPQKAIEMMERHREEAMKNANDKAKAMIKEAVGEEIYNAMPVIGLLAGVFKEEVGLIEQLLQKCGPGDQHIKKLLSHVRNKIIINKNKTDG